MLVPHGTPQREHKRCNCKNSKCLKLYCECFSAGKYCDECNCFNCKNNAAFAAERREAVEATLERNPNAFRPKIAVVASPGVWDTRAVVWTGTRTWWRDITGGVTVNGRGV